MHRFNLSARQIASKIIALAGVGVFIKDSVTAEVILWEQAERLLEGPKIT